MNDILSSRLIDLEQQILINQFIARFNYAAPGSGLNRHIARYEQLQYEGTIAGSEFLIYAATKLYICFNSIFGYNNIAGAALGEIHFADENNAFILYSQNSSIAYEAIAAAIFANKNNMILKNYYFSRFVANVYNYMKFNGYRITLD